MLDRHERVGSIASDEGSDQGAVEKTAGERTRKQQLVEKSTNSEIEQYLFASYHGK